MPNSKKVQGKSDTLPKRKIKSISVQGAEKRYKPTKHYVRRHLLIVNILAQWIKKNIFV